MRSSLRAKSDCNPLQAMDDAKPQSTRWAKASAHESTEVELKWILISLALLVAGIGRSSARNRVWHDNDRLFRQTVLDVPTSYRAHWTLAEHLTNAGQTQEGLEEMLLAVVLGKRDDPGLLSFAADRFRMANQCPRAMGMYRKALGIAPNLPDLRFNASVCLLQLGKLDEARALARDGLVTSGADTHLLRVISVADSLASLSKENNPKS